MKGLDFINNLFIPKKLKVGYKQRSDTFTGKLAYVIYYDEKGKIRKETSWENWRDKDIPAEEFDNTPITGFVINKDVGGVRGYSRWDARKTYMRVYDPRGFEIEIDIPNLLYIMDHSVWDENGLSGEFVYAWDGKELILMPTNAPEYQEMLEFTAKLTAGEFIKPKAFIPGHIYKDKKGHNSVYLGYFEYYCFDGTLNSKQYHFCEEEKLRDVLNKKEKGFLVTTMSSLNKKFMEDVGSITQQELNLALELYSYSYHCSPLDDTSVQCVPFTLAEFKQFMKDDSFYQITNEHELKVIVKQDGSFFKIVDRIISYGWNRREIYVQNTNGTELFTLEDVYNKLKPCYYRFYLKNGKLYQCRTLRQQNEGRLISFLTR